MERKFTEQEIVRREKLERIRELGVEPYSSNFVPSVSNDDLTKKYSEKTKDELNETHTDDYSIAGRAMMVRDQGKAMFVVIKSDTGSIQTYVRQDELSEKEWEVAKLLDIGDYIGVTGRVMKTNTGEVTVRANTFEYLAKALRPLPEKFHGLTDVEEIYRRRYVDLIMNDESKATFLKRSKIISSIRTLLDSKGYNEVETPVLNPILGGASAKPFMTHHNTLDMDMYMRIATELHLKRLIVGGFEKVYEIGRLFRNEGISIKHNPEFTTIELYEAFGDINSMMNIVEEIISNATQVVNETTEINYQGTEISLKAPFKRTEMTQIVKDITGADFTKVKTVEEAREIANDLSVELEDHEDTPGYILNKIFEERCEETIVQPTFIVGYPKEVSPLAKSRTDNPDFTDRFELFIDGREYANAYSELNDPDDQYERFLSQVEEGEKGNDEAGQMDIDYVEALEYGMPHTGGAGIGIDRLVMLLTDSRSIRDVILFPTLKDKE